MFARMIQLVAKPGRGKELHKTLLERSLRVLKEQPGFIDAIALIPETEQDQFVGISIWKSKSDADKFMHGQGEHLMEFYKPLLQTDPTFRSFNVENSTIHETSSRAASR
jgi:heme-degrading monooxygenase HmoA